MREEKKVFRDVMPNMGGDPEFFIAKKRGRSWTIFSADKFFKGKHDKNTAGASGEFFFDGVQAEVNINPNLCRECFIGNIESVIANMTKVILDSDYGFNKRNLLLLPKPTVKINKNTIKDADDECKRFGCEPDYCIYNDKPIDYPDGNEYFYRFSGGHIHLGFEGLNLKEEFKEPERVKELIEILDIFLGTLSAGIAHGEMEEIRRTKYGRAGTYRMPDHGLEYRGLSSFWMAHPILVSMVYGIARNCMSLAYKGMHKEIIREMKEAGYTLNDVVDIINNVDNKKYKKFYNNFVKPFWENHYNQRGSNILGKEGMDDIINFWIDNGYEASFEPRNMKYYWMNSDVSVACFGINSFRKAYLNGSLELDNVDDVLLRKQKNLYV